MNTSRSTALAFAGGAVGVLATMLGPVTAGAVTPDTQPAGQPPATPPQTCIINIPKGADTSGVTKPAEFCATNWHDAAAAAALAGLTDSMTSPDDYLRAYPQAGAAGVTAAPSATAGAATTLSSYYWGGLYENCNQNGYPCGAGASLLVYGPDTSCNSGFFYVGDPINDKTTSMNTGICNHYKTWDDVSGSSCANYILDQTPAWSWGNLTADQNDRISCAWLGA